MRVIGISGSRFGCGDEAEEVRNMEVCPAVAE